jgi:hypothetical protein
MAQLGEFLRRGTVAAMVLMGGAGMMVGCQGAPSALAPDGGLAGAPACRAPAGRTTLADGPIGWTWISGDQVLYSTTDGLWGVPLAGGMPVQIAPGAAGVGVVAGTLYYTAEPPSGAPSSDGRQSSAPALYAAAFTGGPIDPSAAVLVADNFFTTAVAADQSSLYAASGVAGAIVRLTPSEPAPAMLTLDGTLSINALAADPTYLYAAVSDLSAQPGDGFIARLPKSGGRTERLTAPAGYPEDVAVDATGLYWIQKPPVGSFGNAQLLHASLTGQNVTTLDDGSRGSPSALALGPSALYLLDGALERMGKPGGAVESLTGPLDGAGLLRVSGADVIWVDNAVRALSSAAPVTLEVTCASPALEL